MIAYRVVFAPKALTHLTALYQSIATASSPARALDYAGGVVSCCESLRHFPHRGTKRDDIRTGLRLTHYRRRTAIAFRVTTDTVVILGIFHGGQDYGAALRDRDG